jgi:hypothetical protein
MSWLRVVWQEGSGYNLVLDLAAKLLRQRSAIAIEDGE